MKTRNSMKKQNQERCISGNPYETLSTNEDTSDSDNEDNSARAQKSILKSSTRGKGTTGNEEGPPKKVRFKTPSTKKKTEK